MFSNNSLNQRTDETHEHSDSTNDDAPPLSTVIGHQHQEPHHHADGHHHSTDHGHHPTTFSWLLTTLRHEKSDLWVIAAYGVVVGIFSLIVPISTQSLVNTIAFGALIQPLVVLSLLIVVVLGVAGLLRAIQAKLVERLQQRVFARVALDLAVRLPRTKADAFDSVYGPELLNRFFDVLTVQKAAASILLEGVSITLQATVGMTLLAFYHPALLAFDVLLMACIASVFFVLGRGAVETSINESKSKYEVGAWLEELARHVRSFRGTSASAFALQKMDQLVGNYISRRKYHFKILFRQIVGSLILYALASSILLGLGGWLVIQRQLTLGQLVAAELVVGGVLAALVKFGKQLETFYDLAAASDKLGHLAALPQERAFGERGMRSGPAEIVARKISYRFSERTILDPVDLHLAPGSITAIVGPTGSGKSILVDLLTGLRAPSSGMVEMDGEDVQERSLQELRDTVRVVGEPEIFSGSILENVRMGNRHINIAKVREVLDTVGLLQSIRELPDGIHTTLLSGGAPFSSGQRRLIELARALVHSPRLLVIDGLFERIDAPTAHRIKNLLAQPNRPWTVVVVGHDLAVLPSYDQLIVLGQDSHIPSHASVQVSSATETPIP